MNTEGVNLYYEIHGEGFPLVLIHGGGSTINTSFGTILPLISRSRKVIAVELQGNGHTPDRDTPFSFEQDAADVVALLTKLEISSADFFGFSNGGNTTMMIAMRYPAVVRKLVIASSFYKRDAFEPQFWDFMENASMDNMPAPLQAAYREVAPDPDALITMHDKSRDRMLGFTDWKDEDIKTITMPALLILGDQDVICPEHAVAMYRLLPNARLTILPANHGSYLGEASGGGLPTILPAISVAIIEMFLDEAMA